jgi:hypothetical protein
MGQSRQQAMKTRLETLERLFVTLQNKPADEADRLLQRIRASDDLLALPIDEDDSSSDSPSVFSPNSCSTSDESTLTPNKPSLVPEATIKTSPAPISPASSTQLPVDSTTMLVRLIMPEASVTRRAIENFYSSSGDLFHVFSHEQALQYFDQVFGNDLPPPENKKAIVCCIAAIAAVGVQYNTEEFDEGLDAVYYDVTRHCFSDIVEHRPLDAIKVCTLLAMFNVLDKATVSLAYVGK